MARYALRRILYGLVVLAAIVIVVFSTLRLVPGSVVELRLADSASVTQEQIDELTDELGLNDPLPVQLGNWVGNAVQGDLGESFWTGEPVADEIAERLPRTLQLGSMAIVIGTLAGLPIGVISAVRQGRLTDQLLRLASVVGLSVPNFFLGLLFVVYLGIWFNWSPPLLYSDFIDDPWANLQQTVLPALALSTALMASVARMVRSSMLENLSANFIRTVEAKGVSPFNVIYKHGLRNSFLSVFTLIGLQVGGVLGGTVLLESIFSIPGIGDLTFSAVTDRDYPVVVACVLIYGAIFVAVNLIVDLAYGVIDPRISHA